MAEKYGAPMISFVDLAKRQLNQLSERAAFLAPVSAFADISWRILLLLYAAGDVRTGIPQSWEKELNVPMHTLRRYLEMLNVHGYIRMTGSYNQPAKLITLDPEKKRAMTALLRRDAQSDVSPPENSDFG